MGAQTIDQFSGQPQGIAPTANNYLPIFLYISLKITIFTENYNDGDIHYSGLYQERIGTALCTLCMFACRLQETADVDQAQYRTARRPAAQRTHPAQQGIYPLSGTPDCGCVGGTVIQLKIKSEE